LGEPFDAGKELLNVFLYDNGLELPLLKYALALSLCTLLRLNHGR